MDRVGKLRLRAYEAEGFVNAGYRETLRALGASGEGRVLVAVDGAAFLGTVMLLPYRTDSEVAFSADEAEVRALAVDPAARGRGIARRLLNAVVDAAVDAGARRLVLCTQPRMHAAQRLYESEGFVRLPERDWAPLPDLVLKSYVLDLARR